MLAELLAIGLLRANLAACAAMLVVLGLRGVAAKRWGRDAAFRLWRTVPAAALASLFPGLGGLGRATLSSGPMARAAEQLAPLVDGAWLAGVVIGVGMLAAREAAFRRSVALGRAGPAVMGVLWPRLVTPHDFPQRFTPAQRALIIAHERAHIARGDTRAGMLIAVCQALAWGNPFAATAARLARLDLELACDADVLASRPETRRAYGEALLAAQRMQTGAAACAWRSVLPVEARLRALCRDGPPRPASGTLPLVDIAPAVVALLIWAAAPTCAAVAPISWRHAAPVILIDLSPRRTAPTG